MNWYLLKTSSSTTTTAAVSVNKYVSTTITFANNPINHWTEITLNTKSNRIDRLWSVTISFHRSPFVHNKLMDIHMKFMMDIHIKLEIAFKLLRSDAETCVDHRISSGKTAISNRFDETIKKKYRKNCHLNISVARHVYTFVILCVARTHINLTRYLVCIDRSMVRLESRMRI